MRILYGSAFSVVPGLVHVKDFQLRIQDSNIQMEIDIKKTSVWVNVFTLFKRTFTASHVKADGVTFHLRFRRAAPEVLPPVLASLAKIDGLDSIFKKGVEENNQTPSNPWQIHIPSVALTLNEVWFEEFLYQGDIKVGGGFYLYPKHFVEVYPSSLEIHNGELQIGKTPFLKTVSGKISAEIKRFIPDNVPGLTLFRNVSASVDLWSQMQGLQFLNYYLKNTPSIRFGEGIADGKFSLKLINGVLLENSHIDIDAEKLTAQLWHHSAKGRGAVRLRIQKDNRNELSLKLEDFDLRPEGGVKGVLVGPSLELTAYSTGADVLVVPPNLNIRLKIPNANLSDLRYWNSYLPKTSPFSFQGGEAKLAVNIDINAEEEGKDKGQVRLEGKNVSLQFKKNQVVFNLDSVISFKESSVINRVFNLGETSATVVAEDLENWNGKLNISRGKFRMLKSEPDLDLDFSLTGTDARPFLFLLGVSSGILKAPLAFPSFRADAKLRLKESEFELKQIQMSGESRSLVGWWKDKDEEESGRFLFQYGPLAVGLEKRKDESHIRLQDAVSWYEKKESLNPIGKN